MALLLLFALFQTIHRPALAGTLDIAVFHTSLARDGPGLLLRDILRGEDAQIRATVEIIVHADADILLLLDVDYDHDLLALKALRDRLGEAGTLYPHVFALLPNSGMATGLDLDRDGRRGGPRDAQGYGHFSGQGGMALLSRFPILAEAVQSYSAMLWRDMPGALLSSSDGTNLLLPEEADTQRLSYTGHWVVPVEIGNHLIHLLAFHASPPVFDAFEDINARRNHDEAAFWTLFLDGRFGPPPAQRFVLLGGSNMDAFDSAGRPEAMRALLADQRLQDPKPRGAGARVPTPGHRGDPGLDTARWPPPGPGNLRAEYILPSADLFVEDAYVLWPEPDDPMAATAERASRHHLVGVTLAWP